MRRHLKLALLLLSTAPSALSAQSAQIIGRARAAGDSARAVAGAEVTLLPAVRESVSDSSALRRALTDNNGTFRFTGVADGLYQLRVRRLGFDVRDMDVQVTAQQDRALDIAMTVGAQQLGSVVVRGKKIEFPVRYSEAYQRMSHENGDYFTREKIDSMHALDLRTVMNAIPGVTMNDRGINFTNCMGNAFAKLAPTLSSSPNGGTAIANGPVISAQSAKVQVYVDGNRVTNYYGNDSTRDAAHELRRVNPASVQLLEVYRGTSRIPGKYLDDACAVILIWTK